MSFAYLLVAGSKEIGVEGGEAIVEIALDHLPARLVDGIDGFDALEAQLVGTNAQHRPVVFMEADECVR